jgi:hypothetical protein
MVAEEEARNTAKGFWGQLLGAMQRGDLPAWFGVARRLPTPEQRQLREAAQSNKQPSAPDAPLVTHHGRLLAALQRGVRRAWSSVARWLPMPGTQPTTTDAPPAVQTATASQLAAQPSTPEAPPAEQPATAGASQPPSPQKDVEAARSDKPSESDRMATAYMWLAWGHCWFSQLCARVSEPLADLYWGLPWLQLAPGNMRFRGSTAELWTYRAHNFLKLVRAASACTGWCVCLDIIPPLSSLMITCG